jgi:hypothetical protein
MNKMNKIVKIKILSMNKKRTAINSPNKKKFSNKKVIIMINYNKYKIKPKRMKFLAFKSMISMKT